MSSRIGDLLLQNGLITQKDLDDWLSTNSSSPSFIGAHFVESGLVSEKRYLVVP